ncbi:hypothetical protein [Peribacillus kribbensis]|uniref:hypothetical protein n=1 Tax=Peribacillus kribbensis TaxID=356658 RepID=UPI0003F9BCC6|nr:hypothetical protein [Peribacillus kribbensis]
MEKNMDTVITEYMVSRYHELHKQSKQIEKEMNELKNSFHCYFDQAVGREGRGELEFPRYKLQRQVRKAESYQVQSTIELLEKMNLTDCIEIVRRPHDEKIKSAITLGFLEPTDLEECIIRKITAAIVVKEK